MCWTAPTALFFAAIGALLVVMAIWELRSPCAPRRGLLRIRATRGDRLFLGLLSMAYANLAWIGLSDLSPWLGLWISLLLLAAVTRWA